MTGLKKVTKGYVIYNIDSHKWFAFDFSRRNAASYGKVNLWTHHAVLAALFDLDYNLESLASNVRFMVDAHHDRDMLRDKPEWFWVVPAIRTEHLEPMDSDEPYEETKMDLDFTNSFHLFEN